jgi:uncharacterized membrane protein YhaH (DUF805 family)
VTAKGSLDLQTYVWGNGRVSRKPYWMVVAWVFGISILAGFMEGLTRHAPNVHPIFKAFEVVAVWGGNWLGVCNLIRRFHDLGRSGWWLLLSIPAGGLAGGLAAGLGLILHLPGTAYAQGQFAGSLVWLGIAIVLGSLRGEDRANRFGPSPVWNATTPVAVFD